MGRRRRRRRRRAERQIAGATLGNETTVCVGTRRPKIHSAFVYPKERRFSERFRRRKEGEK